MIQLQFLSYVLNNKDMSIVKDNNIDSNYFLEYEDEYKFVEDHYNTYKKVPDIETFMSKFPDFDLVDVSETQDYLVNTLREEYLYSKVVPVIKKSAELLKTDANEATHYLQSEMINLQPNYRTSAVDIIHSTSRIEMFEDKSKHPDKWYIPTGFEELDDIIGGWQKGEEFVVVYARTGNGKSWVVVKFAEHAWLMGENVGYVSPEMSADKIGYRFDTLYHHYSNRALVRGDVSSVTIDDYQQYGAELARHENRFLVTTPRDFNNKVTVSKLRTFVEQNKLGMLVVDGITYLTDERYKRGDTKTTSLTNISEDLMQLSCELKIPVIVVVQSNRGGVKEDANATPDLEDIRDSDGISHNSTKVISLRQKGGEALLMEIKKHRDGEFGKKLTYMWNIDEGRFEWTPGEGDDAQPERRHKRQEEIKETHSKERKVVF